jgi:hypothetical protein
VHGLLFLLASFLLFCSHPLRRGSLVITLYRQVFAQCHHGAVLLGCPGHAWATTNSFFEQEQMMTGSVVKMATLAAAAACVLAVATPAQAQDTKIVLGMSG